MTPDLASTLRRKTAILFDLFHTLTSLESAWSSGPMTHEMLGVSKEDWNRQLLECSRDRLVGKMTDPYPIIRRMAHAIDQTLSETASSGQRKTGPRDLREPSSTFPRRPCPF